MLNQILRPITRRVVQKGNQIRLKYDDHHHFKHVTFDEACVPQGSWKEGFDKKQKKYNVHLFAGVTIFSLTIATIAKFELIFFNYLPPAPIE